MTVTRSNLDRSEPLMLAPKIAAHSFWLRTTARVMSCRPQAKRFGDGVVYKPMGSAVRF